MLLQRALSLYVQAKKVESARHGTYLAGGAAAGTAATTRTFASACATSGNQLRSTRGVRVLTREGRPRAGAAGRAGRRREVGLRRAHAAAAEALRGVLLRLQRRGQLRAQPGGGHGVRLAACLAGAKELSEQQP